MKIERAPKAYALLFAAVLGTSACSSNVVIDNIPTQVTSADCIPDASGVLEDMQLTPGFKRNLYHPNHTSVTNEGNCARIVDPKTNVAIGALARKQHFFVKCVNVAVKPQSLRVETEDLIGNVDISDELDLRIRGEGQQPFEIPIIICPYDYAIRGTTGPTKTL